MNKKTKTVNDLITSLQNLDKKSQRVILDKLKSENSFSGNCQFFCSGHNLPKHNKLY
jgi:hypothetical protein